MNYSNIEGLTNEQILNAYDDVLDLISERYEQWVIYCPYGYFLYTYNCDNRKGIGSCLYQSPGNHGTVTYLTCGNTYGYVCLIRIGYN